MRFPDDNHVNRIAEALWTRSPNGNAAVLVGAGFSRNAKPARTGASVMPGWNDLYREMVDKLYPQSGSDQQREFLLSHQGATSSFLRIAEEFKAHFGPDALDALIVRSVPDEEFEPGELHAQLLQLPWADVLTTNWDTLLERSAQTLEERVYDLVSTAIDIPGSQAPRIVKLHGSLPSQRPFIFTEEDFRTYPVRFAPFINLARECAMENTLVLLGFSGEDPNFLYWSGWVRDQLGASAPLIYLVGALELSASRRKMLEAQRVQPVDLATLPDYCLWPAAQRIALANQYFLERLREAEPYRAERWPRPKARPRPALQLVTPRADNHSPISEPNLDGPEVTDERLAAFVHHWERNRKCYAGWVVPPLATSDYLWSHLRLRLGDVIRAIRAQPPHQRIKPLFELNWQLERALIPLALTIDDLIVEVLQPFLDGNEDPPTAAPCELNGLGLALLRHAREEGDRTLFTRLLTWLEPRLAGDPEARDRLIYERCLELRASGELELLDRLIGEWQIEGDPFWAVRKAGLLAGLGQDEEAGSLALGALVDIRRRTRRGHQDIASWSRETFAMLFRWFFLHGQLHEWQQHQADREAFDERQDLLNSRGCPGRSDFFLLQQELSSEAPVLKNLIERNPQFDIGSLNTKFHLGGEDPRATRLRAYQALRFQEEAGLPARVAHVDVFGTTLEHAAFWLAEVAPHRALDALFQALPSSTEKLQKLISRESVAQLDEAQANDLFDRLVRLIALALQRSENASANRRHWLDRLKSAIELLSRIVVRVSGRAEDAMRIAHRLLLAQHVAHRAQAGDQLQHLLKRSFELLSTDEASQILLELLSLPIQPVADSSSPFDFTDGAASLGELHLKVVRTADWDEPISLILDAASVPGQRRIAIARLELLMSAGVLTEREQERFGAALWSPHFLKDGVPTDHFYWPSALLDRPYPADRNPQQSLARLFLSGEELTDAIVRDGKLENLLANDSFAMTDEEIARELGRLERFVDGHEPPSEHPFTMFDRTDSLIDATSNLFAALCRRAKGVASLEGAAAALARKASFPLRLEPALPALVSFGAIDEGQAVDAISQLLDDEESQSYELREATLAQFVRSDHLPSAFEAEVWECVRLRMLMRSSVLPHLLRLVAHALLCSPGRIASSFDASLQFLLRRLLAETDTTKIERALPYDRFAARYWAMVLAARLGAVGRISDELEKAWIEASNDDPLPDTRLALARTRARDDAQD
jgi:hypothetical protein